MITIETDSLTVSALVALAVSVVGCLYSSMLTTSKLKQANFAHALSFLQRWQSLEAAYQGKYNGLLACLQEGNQQRLSSPEGKRAVYDQNAAFMIEYARCLEEVMLFAHYVRGCGAMIRARQMECRRVLIAYQQMMHHIGDASFPPSHEDIWMLARFVRFRGALSPRLWLFRYFRKLFPLASALQCMKWAFKG